MICVTCITVPCVVLALAPALAPALVIVIEMIVIKSIIIIITTNPLFHPRILLPMQRNGEEEGEGT